MTSKKGRIRKMRFGPHAAVHHAPEHDKQVRKPSFRHLHFDATRRNDPLTVEPVAGSFSSGG